MPQRRICVNEKRTNHPHLACIRTLKGALLLVEIPELQQPNLPQGSDGGVGRLGGNDELRESPTNTSRRKHVNQSPI